MDHPRHILALGILLAVFVLGGPALATTDALPVRSPITLTANQGRSLAPNRLLCEFAPASPLDTPHAHIEVLVRNTSDRPITFTRIQPSCSCTSASFVKTGAGPTGASNQEALPALAPGETATLRVQMDTTKMPAGSEHKSIALYIAGDPDPAATVDVMGAVQSLITFTPPLIDFGRAPAGTSVSRAITVSYDPRLVTKNLLPALVSNRPDMRVTPGPQLSATQSTTFVKAPATIVPGGQPGQARKTDAAGYRVSGNGRIAEAVPPAVHAAYQPPAHSNYVSQVFTVTLLPHATLGPINGALAFAVAPPANGAEPDVRYRILSQASLLMVGSVIGDVTAAPQTVSFGTVSPGRATLREVTLSTTEDADLGRATAESASRWLTAQFEEVTTVYSAPITSAQASGGSAAPSSGKTLARRLIVSILPSCPAGLFQTQVKVTLANGQCLIVPVNAYVSVQGQTMH